MRHTPCLQALLPPVPSVAPAVVSLPALGPGNLSLTAPPANCSLGPCTAHVWAVTCIINEGGGRGGGEVAESQGNPGRRLMLKEVIVTGGPAFNRTGLSGFATIGLGASHTIDLSPLVNYTCTARQLVTDVLERTEAGPAATFEVCPHGLPRALAGPPAVLQ